MTLTFRSLAGHTDVVELWTERVKIRPSTFLASLKVAQSLHALDTSADLWRISGTATDTAKED